MKVAIVLLAAGTFVFCAGQAAAQSNPKIERMPPVAASRLLNGLGWNVDPRNEWEFEKVKSARGSEVRVQFSWGDVESYSTGALALPRHFQAALGWCRQYGLEPLIVAAYGPPAARLMEVILSADVAAGSVTLPVSGDLTAVKAPACHILKADRTHIVPEGRWSYQGALIHAVDAGAHTLTLAAATSVPLSAGTKLVINQLRYPSVATNDPADPGLAAYHRYVRFLADQIAAAGLVGKVEIWNEPPWGHDPWDHRGAFYDNDKVPPGVTRESPNWGMLRSLLTDSLPKGVRYTWGGSHKSGTRGVLFMPPPAATEAQVSASVSSEGWHPYGPTPETHLWDPDSMGKGPRGAPTALEGASAGSNFKFGRARAGENLQKLHWTVPQQISEAGLPGPDQTIKARYMTRYFLANMADGPLLQLERINFYRLAERADGYAMIDGSTRQELAPYTALKELMNDIATIGAAPVNTTGPAAAAALPTVAAPYAGFFPLMTIPILGRADAAERINSCLFVCYQRTYADNEKAWGALTPAAVPVKIAIPKDTAVQGAVDLVTRQPVSVTLTTAGVAVTATLPIAANPVAIKIVPRASIRR